MSSAAFVTAISAHAEDSDCRGFGSLSDNPEITLGQIKHGPSRIYFVKDGSDVKNCPNAKDACRAKAFLVPGDSVILSNAHGAFVCADYIGAKGADRAGWLRSDAVARQVSLPVTLPDWIGTWTREEAKIRLKSGPTTGELSIQGDATYGALDPDRVKRGAVNIGEIKGTMAPKEGALSFTTGDAATLPIDKGGPNDCKLWMRRLGAYLLVDDNNQCGGINVTFRGVYIRKG